MTQCDDARDRACAARHALAVGCAAAIALSGGTTHARCPDASPSSCIDAETWWVSAPRGRFVALPSAARLETGRLALAGAVSVIRSPLTLDAPSPDPNGRELRVVDNAWTATMAGAYGLPLGFEVSAAVPVVLWQAGSGLSGVTTRTDASLRHVTLRDPRLGVARSLWSQDGPVELDVKADFTLAIPLGDESHFAGERGFVWAPSLLCETQTGRLLAGLHLGARLRETSTLGDARLGSQLIFGVGAGASVLGDGGLDVVAEAVALPVLASQSTETPDGARSDGTLVPAEAWLGLRSAPWGAQSAALQLATAMGLPLSSVTRTTDDGAEARESRSAITTPAFRVVATVAVTLLQ